MQNVEKSGTSKKKPAAKTADVRFFFKVFRTSSGGTYLRNNSAPSRSAANTKIT